MLNRKLLGAKGVSVDPAAWDISYAQWNGEPINYFDVSCDAMFIKPDGTKLYTLSSSTDDVKEHNLSTAWDISTASYVRNFSVSAQDGNQQGLFFKSDGTKMYVVGYDNDNVSEYTLSTAWDVSTASYVQNFSVAAQAALPFGLFFKPDGTKMYVMDLGTDAVKEYDLSVGWDISSTTYVQSFSVATQETNPRSVFFKDDGTKMYIIGTSGDDVNEYSLSTAWDISTASYVRIFSVAGQTTSPLGVFFKDDGLVMYAHSSGQIFQYQLSTAWDISTATYSNPTTKYFSVAAQEINPYGLFFKPDGTKMYIIGSTGDDVNEYNLSTAWNLSTATYVQNFSVAAQETFPQDLFFKPDGTKMYILGGSGLDVGEYNLSTAWDISTAVFLQFFSISAQDTVPTGLYFRNDGLKMYVVGDIGNNINEYTLSTAWDVSTAVFLQLFSVGSQETTPQSVFFKPDGTKMYVVGSAGDDVNEYNLSVAWSISTASFVRNFSVLGQTTDPSGIFFKDDGLKMYVISTTSDAIWEYDLV